MKFVTAAVVAALVVASPVSAFTSRGAAGASRQAAQTSLFMEPGALTDYMVKAHEDKLKAVQEAEQKKNAEIEVNLSFFAI
jgi:membrane glycosyltransferase